MEALIALGIAASAVAAYCLWCCLAVNRDDDE
jgi:hypothetical protein